MRLFLTTAFCYVFTAALCSADALYDFTFLQGLINNASSAILASVVPANTTGNVTASSNSTYSIAYSVIFVSYGDMRLDEERAGRLTK